MTIDDAIAAVRPVAHGDSEMQKREILAGYLTMLEVLHARRVIASLDEVPVTLESGETVVLRAESLGPLPVQKPWSYRKIGDAVYFNYVEVANTPEQSLAEFADEMFTHVDGKLIIDLRENWGGNGSLNRVLLHHIIRAKSLQTPGNLFVLTGRRTFSAAIMFLRLLELHTKAIFIGEPTGGAPNGYGDSRKVVLPESGLTVRISTLYWQLSDPRDTRTSMEPHIPAHPTASDFRAQHDEALAVALDYFGGAPSSTIAGDWSGTISLEHNRVGFTIHDGTITSQELDVKGMKFELRAGTKRLAGTLKTSGLEFLVTAERRRDAAGTAAFR